MTDDMISRDDFARVVGIKNARIAELEEAIGETAKTMVDEEHERGVPLCDLSPRTSDAIFDAAELQNGTRGIGKSEAIRLGDPEVGAALLLQARRERDEAREALRDVNRITHKRGRDDPEDILDEIEARAAEGLGL